MFSALRAASTARNPEEHAPHGGDTAGQAAEAAVVAAAADKTAPWGVFRALQALGLAAAGPRRVFGRVRLRRDARHAHGCEIDVVLLEDAGVVCVEVKAWAGRVTVLPDGRWEQRGVRHADPVAATRAKAARLQEHLGGDVPVVAAVVFVNSNVADLPDVPGVFGPEEWAAALAAGELGGPRPGPGLWARLFGPASSSVDVAAVSAALEALPTWDSLTLFGGATLEGDALRFRGVEGARAVGRECARRVQLSHARGALWGSVALVAALAGREPSIRLDAVSSSGAAAGSVYAPVTATLLFHVAGEPSPRAVPLNEVEEIRYGSGSGSPSSRGRSPSPSRRRSRSRSRSRGRR